MTWTKASSGAYMPYPQRKVENAALGPLTGLTFTAKDMFDVKGYPTSAGSDASRDVGRKTGVGSCGRDAFGCRGAL